jgi:hypothetical protein
MTVDSYGAHQNNLLRYYPYARRCVSTDWAEKKYANAREGFAEVTFAGPSHDTRHYPLYALKRGTYHFCAFLVDPSVLSARPETKKADRTLAHASFTWRAK